ncbi:MAG: glycosyl transferase family 2 [Segetibacter sp.]|nr:glycosyl transferase family 2 [Segetibacter sp.]
MLYKDINQPLVSVILSTYNSEKYIENTLQSLLTQTWLHLEIIVVNDGSTDNTRVLLQKYWNKGVIIVHQENSGQDAALNHGYRHSTGEYVKFMDSDDLLNQEMIATQVKALNGSKEHVGYGEWARFYNNQPGLANFTPLDYWKDMAPIDFITARPEGIMLQCGSILIPRELISKAGLWDERLILFNDTEFFNRIILASKGVIFTPGARLYYRSGQSKSISAQRSKKFFESTYLATCLMGEQLLEVEDSFRVRNLISNMFQYRYFDMYPRFPDLCKKHEEMIAQYGCVTIKPAGGKIFKILSKLVGWKNAKSVQFFFYNLGYLKLLNRVKRTH